MGSLHFQPLLLTEYATLTGRPCSSDWFIATAFSSESSSWKSTWQKPREPPVLLSMANLIEEIFDDLKKSRKSFSVTFHERLPTYADRQPRDFSGSVWNSVFLFLFELAVTLHLSTLIYLLPLYRYAYVSKIWFLVSMLSWVKKKWIDAFKHTFWIHQAQETSLHLHLTATTEWNKIRFANKKYHQVAWYNIWNFFRILNRSY